MDAVQSAILLDPGLREDLRASRSDFFPGEAGLPTSGDEAQRAERRHLEWFLIERSSPESQKDRIATLVERCAEESGGQAAEWRAALDGSHASFFEVTAVEPGRGMTLLDLAGLFECPAVEAEGACALAVGDMIAGRVFPIGDGLYRVSPAASMWRNATFLAAIRADLEHARAKRSPTARSRSRLRQSEIEAILHAWMRDASGERGRSPGAVTRARELFLGNGLSREEADEFLEWLTREAPDPTRILPGGGDVLGEVLNALAFETRVDLEAARTVLIDAWDELHAVAREPVPLDSEIPGPTAPRPDVATAVAEFDRKRRAGAPLDQAMRDLERDLDLEDSESSDELDDADENASDLPGVVGGLVEEFLWDEERVHGEVRALRYRSLRGLGRCADQVSVFESLGPRELTDFACRWAIEAGELRDPKDAEVLLEGLGRFCHWAEENHDVPLHTVFAPVLTALQESLPRVTLANRACAVGAGPGGPEWLELVERQGKEEAILIDLTGRPMQFEMSPLILEHLHPGDLIRGRRAAGRGLLVEACYPAELRQVLKQ